MEWKPHLYWAGPESGTFESPPDAEQARVLRPKIEPWLASVFQSEHLSLLVGNGLTVGTAAVEGVASPNMDLLDLDTDFDEIIKAAAIDKAASSARREPNFEDQLDVGLALWRGLRIQRDDRADCLRSALNEALQHLMAAVAACERDLKTALGKDASKGAGLLQSFLMSFASRAASRERLDLFTTNYDRLIEHGCDQLGIRVLDRFVGSLEPTFRASRLPIDLHYNPPGIRGEPRFLEGVIRLTKIHGSLDWRYENGELVRAPLAFGSDLPSAFNPLDSAVIFPNTAKAQTATVYPYSELFRDFAAATCRPNASLVTYGYGFGDDHVNRVVEDMLILPTTHLVVIAWDDPGDRIRRFLDRVNRPAQTTVLIGNHFGSLENLVRYYLPKPAIDVITVRKAALVERRGDPRRLEDREGGQDE